MNEVMHALLQISMVNPCIEVHISNILVVGLNWKQDRLTLSCNQSNDVNVSVLRQLRTFVLFNAKWLNIRSISAFP
jgi:hypothetical protein